MKSRWLTASIGLMLAVGARADPAAHALNGVVTLAKSTATVSPTNVERAFDVDLASFAHSPRPPGFFFDIWRATAPTVLEEVRLDDRTHIRSAGKMDFDMQTMRIRVTKDACVPAERLKDKLGTGYQESWHAGSGHGGPAAYRNGYVFRIPNDGKTYTALTVNDLCATVFTIERTFQ
jgi:hypothetical protein